MNETDKETPDAPILGVLVLAGLLDPCGDIGTQCRYDLLPIPWGKAALAAKVTHTILVELGEKARIQHQATWYPDDGPGIEALARGIGLRAWIVKADARGHKAVAELLWHGWTEALGKKAARVIDRLSFHEPPIDYPWSHENPDDEAATGRFESVLLSRLESCG